MKIYVHNIETGEATSAAIQGEGDYLWVEPADLPPWACAASANYALHLATSEREQEHHFMGVAYIIPDADPTLPCLRMGA